MWVRTSCRPPSGNRAVDAASVALRFVGKFGFALHFPQQPTGLLADEGGRTGV